MKNNCRLLLLFLFTALFSNPRLTIITSVFNGDPFIQHFLNQIEKQTIYSECQHIIINAASPGNEDPIIRRFAATHQNVEYYLLEKDPGLYSVWNVAIKKARAPFLVNANLDDRLAPFAYEVLLTHIEQNPTIDLVYSDAYVTSIPNQEFGNHAYDFSYEAPEFSYTALQNGCFIGSHPIWRRSMHEKHGLFDERFKCAGDWEMWLRAASKGAEFCRVPILTGLNFSGARCLSSRRDLINQRAWEMQILKEKYPAR